MSCEALRRLAKFMADMRLEQRRKLVRTTRDLVRRQRLGWRA